ncbi:hypothetical protein [Geotalea toluenoxydans]|uniref:hypothetical protein n=1 Tax=Geotalea toluenoxydans TaxID=421624 RepID=UPI001FB3D39E|nr:hypothetical protein [Geotalea toluenoxydans]
MATSGSTTSHFLMLYSIHSLLMVMSFQKMETGVADGVFQLVVAHIQAEDFPLGGVEDAAGQGVADKAVDAQDQYFHSSLLLITLR